MPMSMTDSPVFAVLVSLVDIGVVAYLVYRVLLLIRGTRAQQMLVGLGLMAASFFLARVFDLKTLSWILENFISSFLLVVIVVFQHDIRRGLSRVGRRPLFRVMGLDQAEDLIEEVTTAAEVMAAGRMGALIIIEREGDLGEWAETGIVVDAKISTPLLKQIFTPPGPLHDGAVLIQQGRISAASVFLPLTQVAMEQTLGTRHRAAVGITEELDALAVVVSEERGQIAFVEGGNLTHGLDGAMLRQLLIHHLGHRPKRKRTEVPS